MILEKVADYLTELLNYNPEMIIIGRENADQEIFTNDYIVVDILSPANIITTSRKYDAELEKETFDTLLKGKFSFEFYGKNAYYNNFRFINLQNSQLARDLQKKYEITIFKDITTNNLKQILGNKYFDRYECEVMIQFYESNTIDTLRIDEIPTEYIVNE